MEFERKVKIRDHEYANTVYIGDDDKIYDTHEKDLSNMSKIKKIVKIGYYFDEHFQIRIASMPTHLTEVPNVLPVQINSLAEAFTNHKTNVINGIER
ncbi:hypothetical protein JIY74_33465 [Vibrio harveyi]|nr:hypothetical protein [Vibrio harveyi]